MFSPESAESLVSPSFAGHFMDGDGIEYNITPEVVEDMECMVANINITPGDGGAYRSPYALPPQNEDICFDRNRVGGGDASRIISDEDLRKSEASLDALYKSLNLGSMFDTPCELQDLPEENVINIDARGQDAELVQIVKQVVQQRELDIDLSHLDEVNIEMDISKQFDDAQVHGPEPNQDIESIQDFDISEQDQMNIPYVPRKIAPHKNLVQRAQLIIRYAEITLGAEYVKLYQTENPLHTSNPLKSDKCQSMFEKFHYALASKYFSCTHHRQSIFIHRPFVLVYNGMVFIAATILDEFDPSLQVRKYITRLKKKYMKGHLFAQLVRCKSLYKGGRSAHARPRTVISVYDLFLLVKWLSISPSYEHLTYIFDQFLKYMDVEFGAYHGALQGPPFTHLPHELHDFRIEDGETESQAYSRYCIWRKGDLIHFQNTFAQPYAHTGRFDKFFIKTNEEDKLHYQLAIASATDSSQSDRGQKRSRTNNQQDNTSRQRRRGLPRSNSDEEGSSGTRDNGGSGNIPPNHSSNFDGEEQIREFRSTPFHFFLKWECQHGEKSRIRNVVMREFVVMPLFTELALHKTCRKRIKKWIDSTDEQTGLLKHSEQGRVSNMDLIIKQLLEMDIRPYGGSSEYISKESAAELRRERHGLEEQHVQNACETIYTTISDAMEDQITRAKDGLELSWRKALIRVATNRQRLKKDEEHVRSLAYYNSRALLRIHCCRRGFNRSKLQEGVDLSDKSLKPEHFGLPIFGERKAAMMEMLNRYVQSWPEDIAYLKYHNRTKCIPFWMITFFALTMNSREMEANGSPLTICHVIYNGLFKWFQATSSSRTIALNFVIMEGYLIFKNTFDRVEKVMMNPTLSAIFHFGHAPMTSFHVLSAMYHDVLAERDAILLYFLDYVVPLLKKKNVLDGLGSAPLLYSTRLNPLLQYAKEIYGTEEEKRHRQELIKSTSIQDDASESSLESEEIEC